MTKMKDKLFNHTGKKREIVEILIKHFEDSGVEYTCAAVFDKECENRADYLAEELIKSGFNFSKSRYFLQECTRRIFLSAANKEYFKRNFSKL